MADHVQTRCPLCQRSLRIRLDYVGHKVICNHCGHRFVVLRETDEHSHPQAKTNLIPSLCIDSKLERGLSKDRVRDPRASSRPSIQDLTLERPGDAEIDHATFGPITGHSLEPGAEHDLDVARRELQHWKRAHDQLSREVQELQPLRSLADRTIQVERDLEDQLERNQTLETEVEQLRQRQAHHHLRLKSRTKELASLRAELDSVKAQNQSLKDDLRVKLTERDELARERARLQDEVLRLGQEIKETSQEVQRLSQGLADLAGEGDSVNAERESVQALRREIQTLIHERERELDEQLGGLVLARERMEQSWAELPTRLNQEREQWARLVEDRNIQLSALIGERNDLLAELHCTRNELALQDQRRQIEENQHRLVVAELRAQVENNIAGVPLPGFPGRGSKHVGPSELKPVWFVALEQELTTCRSELEKARSDHERVSAQALEEREQLSRQLSELERERDELRHALEQI